MLMLSDEHFSKVKIDNNDRFQIPDFNRILNFSRHLFAVLRGDKMYK
jgi:hypothetical protein